MDIRTLTRKGERGHSKTEKMDWVRKRKDCAGGENGRLRRGGGTHGKRKKRENYLSKGREGLKRTIARIQSEEGRIYLDKGGVVVERRG